MLKKTKSGGSTDADVLEELARLHPLPAKIIEYRQYAKLKNTYVDALPQMVHPADGPRACVVQPGGGGHGPAQLERSESAEHSGPHRERPRDSRGVSAGPRRAGSCWRPTIRRSSCACWRTSRGDATLCEAFARDEDIHARVASAGLRRAARSRSPARCGAAPRRSISA